MPRRHSRGRRTFLKSTAIGTTCLSVPVYLLGCGAKDAPPRAQADFAPNAWVRVGGDGRVTLVVDRSEMGQGVATALPMLLAEELDADWATVRIEQAPANEAYDNSAFAGNQVTGGSSSVYAAWTPLREAGAKARAMLVAAAAARWGVASSSCRTAGGFVLHEESARKASYGELAQAAAQLSIPDKVALKAPQEFKLIGKPIARSDTPDKVAGRAQFGLDVRLPGMLTAVVARAPVFGAKPARFDAGKAKQVAGVRDVIAISSGVAVLAEGYWAASKGREALDIEWGESAARAISTDMLKDQFSSRATADAAVARAIGDFETATADGAVPLEAEYELPFLAHATMEPQNCTADVRKDRCVVWAPTQFQTGDPMFAGGGARGIAMRLTGLPREAVEVNTTQIGGGFGRRLESDYVAEAVELSMKVGQPVQVVWSREDDMQHDVYRPMSYHRLSGVLNAGGDPVGWRHRIVAPSIISRFIPEWLPGFAVRMLPPMKGGVDESAVEGAFNHAYAIPNQLVDWVKTDTPVPIGFWRSVGYSYNSFVVESFVDELAHAAKQDPFEFRRKLLKDAPRQRHVLELAAEKAGWGTPLPSDRSRGIAVAESFRSCVAEVAEVSVKDGQVRVHRVVCAVDCGLAVNPGIVTAQMAGGIIWGLSAALHGEITIQDGRIVQSNFHDYPVVRMSGTPVIEVHIVPSTQPPTGVGEPGVPALAPAVANAVFAATGKRIRSLPIRV